MTPRRLGASFRDPSGFLFEHEGVLYRQVNARYRDEYELLRSGGLYDALVDRGWLIPHEEADVALAVEPGAWRVLRPQRVPFVSYPSEWTFGQLRAAALLTLEVQQRALAHGMTLKDASALNVQFIGARPVFVDTLSFERYEPGRPWVAYRQFCQHFLAPLALMARVDVRLRDLWRQYLDGIPLDLASTLLPRRTRLAPWAVLHIHLHARSIARYGGRAVPAAARARGVSRRGLDGLLDHLAGAVRRLRWSPRGTEWEDYETAHGYAAPAMQEKEQVVRAVAAATKPTTVWDLGANTGRFSTLAAESGAYVVAPDVDPGAAERHFARRHAAKDERVVPLWLDLANPNPAQGWAHAEWRSLAERGPADLVLALALVHHLAIGNNVPLPSLAAFLARIGRRVVVEWVPKQDPQTQRLLVSRADVFDAYTRELFENAFAPHFATERRVALPESDRVLYVFGRH